MFYCIFLATISTTSKDIDLKFSAYSEHVGMNLQIKQYSMNFYGHH